MIQKTLAMVAIMAITLCYSKPASAEINVTIEEFSQLTGRQEDDHRSARRVFLSTCPDMKPQDWQNICALEVNQTNTRHFLEMFFHPALVRFVTLGVFTGYFEPELDGGLQPSKWFQYPTYKTPPNLSKGRPYLILRQVEAENVLASQGLEIAWVDDLVEFFFLQIQGSARVLLPSGELIRLGYGSYNGRSYKSLGAELVRRGIYDRHQVVVQVIQNWVKYHPIAGQNLLRHSPGYLLFLGIPDLPDHKGPREDRNWSLTSMRSLTVDPKFVPLGAPVWLEKKGKKLLNRLMVAQDTESVIKGPQRGDISIGAELEVGRAVAKIKDCGRMAVLLPIQRAYAALLEQGR